MVSVLTDAKECLLFGNASPLQTVSEESLLQVGLGIGIRVKHLQHVSELITLLPVDHRLDKGQLSLSSDKFAFEETIESGVRVQNSFSVQQTDLLPHVFLDRMVKSESEKTFLKQALSFIDLRDGLHDAHLPTKLVISCKCLKGLNN